MARSLVEILEKLAASSQSLADERQPDRATNGDIVMHLHDRFQGKAGALRFAAKLAAPYEARLAALEKVAELAAKANDFPLCPRGDEELIALRDARRAFAQALAAVPEIPEEP